MPTHKTSRRDFLSITSLLGASLAAPKFLLGGLVDSPAARTPLTEFDYADVTLASPLHNQQLDANISVLMELSEDSLLKPLRKMAGLPASGEELGGWYLYDPAFDGRSLGPGFAPPARSANGFPLWHAPTQSLVTKKSATKFCASIVPTPKQFPRLFMKTTASPPTATTNSSAA